jgi:hypothetical protein
MHSPLIKAVRAANAHRKRMSFHAFEIRDAMRAKDPEREARARALYERAGKRYAALKAIIDQPWGAF